MRVRDEIQRRMKALDLSPKRLAKEANLGETAIRDILAGRSKEPRDSTLAKIARRLGCTVDDLKREPKRRPTQSDDQESVRTSVVTEFDVVAAAGGGREIAFENVIAEWRFPTEWLRAEMRGSPPNLHIATIEGDSMAPTLMPGDKVVVDVSRVTPSPPGIFFLHDGMGLVAKRVELVEGSDPPTIRCASDNARYSTYERTAEEVHIVGRVMGRWERLS